MDEPKRIGRPTRGKVAANNIVTLRLTDDELRDWTKRAGDKPLSTWIRERCNRKER